MRYVIDNMQVRGNMTFVQESKKLTHRGVMQMLNAAIETAELIGQPQCIVIVDASGELLGEICMTGAKFLSRKSARAKALTSASVQLESHKVPESVRTAIGLATDGKVTGLPGGFPILIDGCCLGGIGVGSGSGEQDMTVATAALSAVGASSSNSS